jgi:hypothetical protein
VCVYICKGVHSYKIYVQVYTRWDIHKHVCTYINVSISNDTYIQKLKLFIPSANIC